MQSKDEMAHAELGAEGRIIVAISKHDEVFQGYATQATVSGGFTLISQLGEYTLSLRFEMSASGESTHNVTHCELKGNGIVAQGSGSATLIDRGYEVVGDYQADLVDSNRQKVKVKGSLFVYLPQRHALVPPDEVSISITRDSGTEDMKSDKAVIKDSKFTLSVEHTEDAEGERGDYAFTLCFAKKAPGFPSNEGAYQITEAHLTGGDIDVKGKQGSATITHDGSTLQGPSFEAEFDPDADGNNYRIGGGFTLVLQAPQRA